MSSIPHGFRGRRVPSSSRGSSISTHDVASTSTRFASIQSAGKPTSGSVPLTPILRGRGTRGRGTRGRGRGARGTSTATAAHGPSPEALNSGERPARGRGSRGPRLVKPPPFEVPLWAGSNSTNTCTIDGFLTIMLGVKWKDEDFPYRLRGIDTFTSACRTFLVGEDDLKVRKDKFIASLYKPNEEGGFDLLGDEAYVITDQCKSQTTITVTYRCLSCGFNETRPRYRFVVRMQRGDSIPSSMFDTIAKPFHSSCPQCLSKTKKDVVLSVPDDTWLLPLDLSQSNIDPTEIPRIPSKITIAGTSFILGGITLFMDRKKTTGHYACVMYKNKTWLYYDGMLDPPMKYIKNLAEIKRMDVLRLHDPTICKIAYYFRAN
ncbi:hypothetical protein PFISCL1PPCAC_20213 [Pristionchus fissidentatus]|uniref:USP domain-containing protein n=1 Tax=Pristionchus fissidentatus TaxID=1538716 RepID=A0AAV5WAJ1_9BILA|nr:hypothetical protein PFISCL1PPCAC_20213 [Pristionchus fissidentatus]